MSEKGEYKDPLMMGCAQNDRKSQRLLYEKYYSRMLQTCMRYTKNSDEAKDIMQEGFIKIFTSIAGFKETGSFEAWMKKIMINTALDHYRSRQKESFVTTDSDYLLSREDGEFAVPGNNDQEDEGGFEGIDPKIVMDEVQKLSPAYRMVFNMYAIEGYAHKQIAEALGISEGTSKSNLSKAKANLKDVLSKYIIKH